MQQKIRSYQYEVIAGHTFLMAYRPLWTAKGLSSHLSYMTRMADGPPTECVLGEVSLSSLHERETVIRTLEGLTNHANVNWHQLLAAFFGDVGAGERTGRTSVCLADVQIPAEDLSIDLDGWRLLVKHATILFGDGESAKSYVALWLAGRLAQLGKRVLYCDWELSAEDHRLRLGKLFPAEMPRSVRYKSCSGPITELVEDLRHEAEQERIDFAIFDSAAYACRGPAETSEAAIGYFTALRDIGVPGSLTIAHTTKAAPVAGQEKPFGSTFWHNSARATWMVTVAAKDRRPDQLTASLTARKNNLAQRGGDMTVVVAWGDEQTTIELSTSADRTERKAQVLAYVREHPDGSSKNDIYRTVKGKKETCLALIDQLIDDAQLALNADQPPKIVLFGRGQ